MRKISLIITAALVLALGAACQKEEPRKEKPLVVTTTGMIADGVKNIAGDLVIVKALMGPGSDPHSYKATAGDVQKLQEADLIVYNGLHLEAKMADVLEKISSVKNTKAMSTYLEGQGILTVDDTSQEKDPHIWFNVALWARALEGLEGSLVEILPEHKETLSKNGAAYRTSLLDLHESAKRQISLIPESRRVLITAHDAFRYFGDAYGIEVKGLQGISTVSEAGTADVKELADYITKNQIKAIFVESSVPARSIEALQAAVASRGFSVDIGGELFSDAMGDGGTYEGTFIGMVTHNYQTIVKALK